MKTKKNIAWKNIHYHVSLGSLNNDLCGIRAWVRGWMHACVDHFYSIGPFTKIAWLTMITTKPRGFIFIARVETVYVQILKFKTFIGKAMSSCDIQLSLQFIALEW